MRRGACSPSASPRAAALAHFLVANMEATGAVVASYATLSKMSGMSVSTIRRAVDDLKAGRWIEVVQIGGKGGANAFIVNSRVAGPRAGTNCTWPRSLPASSQTKRNRTTSTMRRYGESLP